MISANSLLEEEEITDVVSSLRSAVCAWLIRWQELLIESNIWAAVLVHSARRLPTDRLGGPRPARGDAQSLPAQSAHGYIASSDNFAPLSVLLRLAGTSRWHEDELLVLVLLALAGAWTVRALRGYGMRSWQAFGFVAVFSAMGITIDWNHYGVLMVPLFVVLVVDMSRGHASALDWIGLALAFGLASLVWRPYGTMPANLHTLLRTGHLPPLDGYVVTAAPTEPIAQCGQYVLVAVGLLWCSRRPERGGGMVGDRAAAAVTFARRPRAGSVSWRTGRPDPVFS